MAVGRRGRARQEEDSTGERRMREGGEPTDGVEVEAAGVEGGGATWMDDGSSSTCF